MSNQERAIKTQRAVGIAKEASQSLLKSLKKNLKTHMKRGGPLTAIKYCNLNAIRLTKEVQKKLSQGVLIRRVSLKTRNSSNKATQIDKTILETFEALNKMKTLPPYLMLEKEKSFTYYQPLSIKNPICLKCHGTLKKNSELALFLDKYYPNDKARGYKLNDIRGAIVVEVPHK